MDDSDPDRRKHPRVPMKAVTAAVSCPGPSVGVDLSVGGIRFCSAILDVEVGDALHVELVLQGGRVIVVGTVARVSGVDGSAREISLAFSEVDPEVQQLLAETVALDERYSPPNRPRVREGRGRAKSLGSMALRLVRWWRR